MPCTITDRVVSLDPNNNPVPVVGAKAVWSPAQRPLFVLVAGNWREIPDPTRTVVVNPSTGAYTVVLPWPSEQDPSTSEWILHLPDGSEWIGMVPEGVAGPFTLRDLKNTYNWSLRSQTTPSGSDLIPVAVQGPQGRPGFGGYQVFKPMSETGSGAGVDYVDVDMTAFGYSWPYSIKVTPIRTDSAGPSPVWHIEGTPTNTSFRINTTPFSGIFVIEVNQVFPPVAEDPFIGPLITTSIQTSAYTAIPGQFVLGDATAGSFDITIDSTSMVKDQLVAVKHIEGPSLNSITVLSPTHQIDGASSIALLPGECLILQFDGISRLLIR